MSSKKEFSESFDNLTDEQLSELVKANDELEEEGARIINDELDQKAKRRFERESFRRRWQSPLEIFNRSLLLLFLGSFLFSFVSVYAISPWWFVWYLISAFSCILYIPNRKALKELLDAWPNINDLIKRFGKLD